MNGMVETLNRAAATWWEWTLDSTGQGTLLLLMIVAILAAGRSFRPGLRYGLLLVVLLKFAVPPVFGVAYGFSDLLARAVTSEPAPLVSTELRVAVETAQAPAAHSTAVPVATFVPQAPALSSKTWWLLLESVGAIAIVALIARQCLAVRKLMKHGVAADESLQTRFQAAARAMNLRRAPRLRLSVDAGAPQTGGILRPFVILPAWAATMPEEELDILLAHELAHVWRMDAQVNGLQAAAQALLWWNPAVWWLNRRIREERELCCDDLVLSRGIASGAAYSRTLINVAERVSRPQSTWAMAGMADSFGAIDRRVRRALQGDHAKQGWRRYGAFVVLLLVAGWVLPGATDGEEKAFDAARAAEVEEAFGIRDLTAERSGVTIDGALTRSGKLEFRVISANDGMAALGVTAKGELVYPQGEEKAKVVVEGEIQGTYPDLTVVAKRLTINFDGVVEFFEPTMDSKVLRDLKAARMLLDLRDGYIQLANGKMDEIPISKEFLQQDGDARVSNLQSKTVTRPFSVAQSSVVPGDTKSKARALRISTSILEVSADADVLPDHEEKIAEMGENFVLLGGGVADQWEAFEQACRQAVENGQAKFIASPTVETLVEESASITIGKQVTALENAPANSDLLPVTTVRAAPVAGTDEGGAGALSVEVEIERGLPTGSGVEGERGEKDSTRFVIAPDEMDGDWLYHVTRRDGGKLVIVVVRVVLAEVDQRTSDLIAS